jgi:glycosyltransferase involved in cell wall biosynthesis
MLSMWNAACRLQTRRYGLESPDIPSRSVLRWSSPQFLHWVTQAVETKQSEPRPQQGAVSRKASGASASRRARVLIVESNEDGTVGGSHQALFDLVVGVDHAIFEPIVLFYEDNVFGSRLRARGIEVVLFDEFTSAKRATDRSGGQVAKLLRYGTDVLRCRRELVRLRVDLLHLCNSPKTGNDNWLLAARSLGVPCIVTAMGDVGRPNRLIHRWLYRRFDLYLAVSRHVADALLEHGVDPNRIELIYLGVDLDSLRKRVLRTREAVRDELGVERDQILVLMVGNIRAWKGQREVIAALRLIPEKVLARMRVCFAGATASTDAEYETEVRGEVAQAGLGHCVQFLGYRSDVPDLYRAADIAVHASTSPEPFGLVVPEAMALGCAVIAASFGGPAEVIVPGTGILCDPTRPEEYAGALEQLVRDDAFREAIAAAAPARAAYFSVRRNVEGTAQAYRRALQGRKWF